MEKMLREAKERIERMTPQDLAEFEEKREAIRRQLRGEVRRNPQHSDAVPFASVKVGQRFKAAEDEESGSRLGGSVNWWEKVNEQQAVLVRTGAVYDFRGDEACLVEYIGSGMMGVPKSPAYNREAVDEAIESSNRAGRRISGREARAIHGLLKGWRKNPDDPRSRFGDSLGVGSYGTLLIGKGSRVKPVRVKIVGYRDKVRGETHSDPSARYAVFVEQEGSFRLGITDAKSINPA